MFPFRDLNPPPGPALMTWALLVANLAVAGLVLADPPLAWRLALSPRALAAGQPGAGLVTHLFVHAGPLHLAGNMLFLWVFGPNLEGQTGRIGFVLFYLACGACAAVAHAAWAPDSTVPLIGASGAVAGVMGGYLLLFPRGRVEVIAFLGVILRRYRLRAWVVILAWGGLQLALGLFAQGPAGPAYWAHVGGLAAGVVLALPLFLRRGGRRFWAANKGRPPHPVRR